MFTIQLSSTFTVRLCETKYKTMKLGLLKSLNQSYSISKIIFKTNKAGNQSNWVQQETLDKHNYMLDIFTAACIVNHMFI